MNVPESVEELQRDHDALVAWAIQRTLPHWFRAADTDLADIHQQVYVAILDRHFLDRARQFYQTVSGSFTTSLERLVRNVTLDWIDSYQRRTRRFPQRDTVSEPSAPQKLESQVIACEILDILEQRVRTQPKVRATLLAARQHGTLDSGVLAPALAMDPSTVRRHARRIRQEAHRLVGETHGSGKELRDLRAPGRQGPRASADRVDHSRQRDGGRRSRPV